MNQPKSYGEIYCEAFDRVIKSNQKAAFNECSEAAAAAVRAAVIKREGFTEGHRILIKGDVISAGDEYCNYKREWVQAMASGRQIDGSEVGPYRRRCLIPAAPAEGAKCEQTALQQWSDAWRQMCEALGSLSDFACPTVEAVKGRIAEIKSGPDLWNRAAERPPTAEDADKTGHIIKCDPTGYMITDEWRFTHPDVWPCWCRTDDLLKLHPLPVEPEPVKESRDDKLTALAGVILRLSPTSLDASDIIDLQSMASAALASRAPNAAGAREEGGANE